MKRFLPILNLDFGETPVLSSEEEYLFYEYALKVLAKSFKEIEISFVSDAFVFNAIKILKKANELEVNLSFGSIYEPEQLAELMRLFKEAEFKQDQIKIFSPVYVEAIAEICKEQGFNYIPGFMRKQDIKNLEEIKIFPFNVIDAKSLYAKLCKPYPELRKHMYSSKILFASPELLDRYKVFDNKEIKDDMAFVRTKSGDEVYIIDSPLSYQRIRSRFLFDSRVKVLFDFKDKVETQDLLELASKAKVYITGIKQNEIADELLANDNIFIATRVFSNPLRDLLSGALKIQELEDSFEKELGVYKL